MASAAAAPQTGLGWYRKLRLLLVLSDFAAITVAVAFTFYFLFTHEERLIDGVSYRWASPALVLAWVIVLSATESRAKGVLGSGLTEYRRVITASLYLFGGLAMLSCLMVVGLSRALFVTTLPMGIALLLASRWTMRMWLQGLRKRGRALMPTLVVGTDHAVGDVLSEIRKCPEAGYQVTGVCLTDAHKKPRPTLELGALRLTSRGALKREVSGRRYQAVIVADGLSRHESRDLAWQLENRPIELMFVPRVIDVAGPRLKIGSVEGLSLMSVELPQFSGWKLALKRGFDIVFSLIALILLLPVFAVVAILIKLDDRGPVMFRQERVGRFGEPFTIHKFRTMCLDAESKIDELIAANGGNALLFKLEEDPRITRIGKILRKYSIDELPQFWSVLRGGMSVVGPRPQVSREVAEYTDIHHRRLLIKPGITGLWQVNGRSELSMDESIRLDLRYVENWSLVGDVTIILKTVGVVLRPNGAF